MELRQENCQQLLISDSTITEKEDITDTEMSIDNCMQDREMELVRMKAEGLPVAITGVGKLPPNSSVRIELLEPKTARVLLILSLQEIQKQRLLL